MNRATLMILAALLCSTHLVNGGKILVFPVDGSHWLTFKIILEELHSRGHEITLFLLSEMMYINPVPHYKHMIMEATGSWKDEVNTYINTMLKFQLEGASQLDKGLAQVSMFSTIIKNDIKHLTMLIEDTKLLQKLSDAKYDMVLTDILSLSGVVTGHYLGLPTVLIGRESLWGDSHALTAPSPVSYVPLPQTELSDKMTFSGRVKNLLCYIPFYLTTWYLNDRHYNPFVQKYFGSNMRYTELYQAADLWLLESDFTVDLPRPTMPNFVYISGYQCKPSKPLSTELEDFIQSSGEHGIIVMSLGSFVSKFPQELTEEIAAAFAQLPQKVIWRHEGRRPSTLGNNTLLLNWLPQNDLLGHPKTKLFVTHGGLHGIQEAIYHGVPMVGLPICLDQPDNLFKMKVKGVAVTLNIANVNRGNFLEALKKVLHEPSYRENMKILSSLHRDQPMKPLDRAVYWIEFVMRHKGAPHLKTEAVKLPWMQYYSVDVVLFLLACTLLVLTCWISAAKLLWKLVCSGIKMKRE